jgi:prepilin-type N-terminal cleavage/methylation domain-containing protein
MKLASTRCVEGPPVQFGGQDRTLRRRSLRAAFTIVEVMLAITIFAVILTAVYACWSSAARGSRIGLQAAADAQRDRVARRCIEEALNSAVMFVENRRHYAFIADNSGSFSYLSFVSRLPDTFPGSGMFGDFNLRRITFEVQERGNQGRQLVMTQAPMLLATNEVQEPYTLVLARDVAEFRFEFWVTNSGVGEWAQEWQFTNQYPAMIRYILAHGQVAGRSGSAATVSSGVVAPPAVAVPEFVQTPRGAPGIGNPNQPGGGRNPTGNPPAALRPTPR